MEKQGNLARRRNFVQENSADLKLSSQYKQPQKLSTQFFNLG